MTFNQWCAGKRLDPHFRIALEAVWNAVTGPAGDPRECRILFDELLEAMPTDERIADDAF